MRCKTISAGKENKNRVAIQNGESAKGRRCSCKTPTSAKTSNESAKALRILTDKTCPKNRIKAASNNKAIVGI